MPDGGIRIDNDKVMTLAKRFEQALGDYWGRGRGRDKDLETMQLEMVTTLAALKVVEESILKKARDRGVDIIMVKVGPEDNCGDPDCVIHGDSKDDDGKPHIPKGPFV